MSATTKTFADFGIEIPYGRTGEVDVLCPKCSHTRKKSRDKCLSVNVDEGVWTCHHPHCGWSDGLGSKPEADWRSPMPNRAPKEYKAPRPLQEHVIPDAWARVVKWFEGRGITEAALLEKGVTTAIEFCAACDAKHNHILFPFYVDGKHLNTKHRCPNKHFRMESGAQRVFYNADACKDADTMVIVEGEIDALSCHVAGITNVVSVPDGAPALDAKNYSSKFDFLDSAKAMIDRMKRIIIATDADEPGQKLMEELARRIGPEKCSRVMWMDGVKDANECLIKFGPDILATYLTNPDPFPVEGIYTGHDMEPELLDAYRNSVVKGVDFGPPILGQHYRVDVAKLTIVTGIPGHGKSAALDQMLMWLAERHDWTFALFSPEQVPLDKHQRNLIELHSGKCFSDKYAPRMTETEMLEANRWVSDRFSFILPEEPGIDSILELARIEVFRRGVRGIVIDPWNELEHSRPRHMSETEYISQALSQFRRFARNHRLHLWLVAHPTKMRRIEDGPEPMPGLWDISGSAHFRNKADIGITVWRDIPAKDNQVQVRITKVRWEDDGMVGNIQYGYNPVNKRLIEIGLVREEVK
jgi:twinkle protein